MGQIGSVYKQPETEVDDPVTTRGCQVSGKGHKGEQREQQGEQGNQQGEQGRNAPCLYVTVMYMQKND